MAAPVRVSRDQAVRLLGTGTQVDDVFAKPRKRRVYTPAVVPTVPEDARVVGFDLALGTTGWCVVEAGQCLAFGSFTLPDRPLKGDTFPASLDQRRYETLCQRVQAVVADHDPDYLAFEYPDRVGRGWWDQKRGPLTPYYLGLARGMFVAVAWPVMTFAKLLPVPMLGAKRAITGTEAASKERVRLALHERFGWDVREMTLDQTDAGAIALAVFEGARR
jgi:Holliday junction resolvasome RuvABC endonuclease subunit